MINDYLTMLRETAEFQALIKHLKDQRPEVPRYIPDPDNTEEWKEKSLIRQGFNLCLTHLGEKTDE